MGLEEFRKLLLPLVREFKTLWQREVATSNFGNIVSPIPIYGKKKSFSFSSGKKYILFSFFTL